MAVRTLILNVAEGLQPTENPSSHDLFRFRSKTYALGPPHAVRGADHIHSMSHYWRRHPNTTRGVNTDPYEKAPRLTFGAGAVIMILAKCERFTTMCALAHSDRYNAGAA
jgi:hypothetical protein